MTKFICAKGQASRVCVCVCVCVCVYLHSMKPQLLFKVQSNTQAHTNSQKPLHISQAVGVHSQLSYWTLGITSWVPVNILFFCFFVTVSGYAVNFSICLRKCILCTWSSNITFERVLFTLAYYYYFYLRQLWNITQKCASLNYSLSFYCFFNLLNSDRYVRCLLLIIYNIFWIYLSWMLGAITDMSPAVVTIAWIKSKYSIISRVIKLGQFCKCEVDFGCWNCRRMVWCATWHDLIIVSSCLCPLIWNGLSGHVRHTI